MSLTLTMARAVLVACCKSEDAPLVTFSAPYAARTESAQPARATRAFSPSSSATRPPMQTSMSARYSLKEREYMSSSGSWLVCVWG